MRLKGISNAGMQRLAGTVQAQAKDDGLDALEEALSIAETTYSQTRSVDEAFSAAEKHLEEDGNYAYFGVEYTPYEETGPLSGVEMAYLNAGDTYAATLCYTEDKGFFISSWGDYVENAERQYEEETGERLCGYCGAWSEEVAAGQECPSCGHAPDEWS